MKRAFVRYVSHEIRSPLNIALLGLKYIQDHLRDEKENRSQAEVIQETLTDVRNSCAVAVDVLNDFLLYEKFDDGIFTLSKAEVRISDYFLEAVGVYKVQVNSFFLGLAFLIFRFLFLLSLQIVFKGEKLRNFFQRLHRRYRRCDCKY
jgi:signal transduction histidine kinase